MSRNRKRIRLRCYKASRKAAAEVRAFVRWLETVIDIRHPIDLHVTSRLYGYFDHPGSRQGLDPYIIASLDDDWRDTIAHELAHYEQWRDKRDMTERGVKQRARALVRQWRREAA